MTGSAAMIAIGMNARNRANLPCAADGAFESGPTGDWASTGRRFRFFSDADLDICGGAGVMATSAPGLSPRTRPTPSVRLVHRLRQQFGRDRRTGSHADPFVAIPDNPAE
jgi:hypothetical protein